MHHIRWLTTGQCLIYTLLIWYRTSKWDHIIQTYTVWSNNLPKMQGIHQAPIVSCDGSNSAYAAVQMWLILWRAGESNKVSIHYKSTYQMLPSKGKGSLQKQSGFDIKYCGQRGSLISRLMRLIQLKHVLIQYVFKGLVLVGPVFHERPDDLRSFYQNRVSLVGFLTIWHAYVFMPTSCVGTIGSYVFWLNNAWSMLWNRTVESYATKDPSNGIRFL